MAGKDLEIVVVNFTSSSHILTAVCKQETCYPPNIRYALDIAAVLMSLELKWRPGASLQSELVLRGFVGRHCGIIQCR
jgi:hypothetical protein